MTGAARDDREHARHLMMASLDGELAEADRRQLERLLAADPELRAEWDRLRKVKEVTSSMALRKPPEEVWSRYWVSVYNRIERGLGWVLASVGAIVLLSYGIWQAAGKIVFDPSLPGIVKLAILALVVGAVTVLVSVFREKIFTRRHDPYKEVER